jgi:isoprenylcysteine carboxyl methyltransferase (ICMT) family protein YpbQ
MRFLVDPLMRTIKRHYNTKQQLTEGKFQRFKKKNYMLLLINFVIVMVLQGLMPLIIGQEYRIHSTLSNALDIFSWVILWKPIERLIFYWNPFLKDMLLYKKMAIADVIMIDNEQELINYHIEHSDAA